MAAKKKATIAAKLKAKGLSTKQANALAGHAAHRAARAKKKG